MREQRRKRQCSRGVGVALWLVVIFLRQASGFVLPTGWTRTNILGNNLTSLLAKPKRASSNKNATSKKKESPSIKQQQTNTAAASPPKRKKPTPPWQVLSQKDQQQNIVKEKQRREYVRAGGDTRDFDNNIDSQEISTTFLPTIDRQLLNWKRFNPDKTPVDLKLIGTFLNKRLPPRIGAPEVAFLGRSNVGKSSLLNALTTSTTTKARVGKTPGATASVNLYALVDAKDRNLIGLVDLPGFGYAKLGKEIQENIQDTAENYLQRRRELMLGILLVDIRREPSENDRVVLAALFDMGLPIVVVATKADKVASANERQQCLDTIRDGLGLPEGQPLAVSSMNGEGCRNLWRIILEACESGVQEMQGNYEGNKNNNQEQVVDYNDDDDDELVYSQGYDWIHDSAIMYEEDEAEKSRRALNNNDDNNEDYDYSDDDDDSNYLDNEANSQPTGKVSLKDLRKRAREMERRGDL